MQEVQDDEDLLRSLGDELQGLFRKLPAEYRRGARAIDPSDPDQLRQLVNHAQAQLIQDLKKGAFEA